MDMVYGVRSIGMEELSSPSHEPVTGQLAHPCARHDVIPGSPPALSVSLPQLQLSLHRPQPSCPSIITMPTKRARKNPPAAQKPPSPPLSEKNAVPTEEIPSTEHPAHEESPPPWPLDEDEEMPSETETTAHHRTTKKPAQHPLGAAAAGGGGGGGYNALKSYKGQMYSGMAVGGSHTWTYDQGTWKETKEEPDLWRIDYQTNKRRARNAPAGSGAPVGTEYHWLIVGHQVGCCDGRYSNDWLTIAACHESRCQHIRDASDGLQV